jgi:hypothetical protein
MIHSEIEASVGVGDARALCNPRALCDPWALCVCEASNTFVIPSDKPSPSSISSVVSCLPAMISLKDGNDSLGEVDRRNGTARKEKSGMETQNIPFTKMVMAMREEGDGA